MRTARERGFTLIEVLVAASLLIILCVGTIMVFSQAIKLNRGNDIRMQALTVLQKQVENYRALKYQPVNPDPLLAGHTLTTVATAVPEADCKFKEITIEATPHNPQSGWLADLKTRVSFRRVRLID
jgi:prepilin-type N-terminal cleavage/methylation domain-containing protein